MKREGAEEEENEEEREEEGEPGRICRWKEGTKTREWRSKGAPVQQLPCRWSTSSLDYATCRCLVFLQSNVRLFQISQKLLTC